MTAIHLPLLAWRIALRLPSSLVPLVRCASWLKRATFALRIADPWFARVLRLGFIPLLFALPWPAFAQEVPWKRVHLDLKANNEPLNSVLGRVLIFSGIPATMSPPIATARVNGRLEGSAESIFRELVDTYGLTWYHDGSMLYVYSLAETESRLLQVAPFDVPRVERTLRDMRLFDTRFPLRLSPTEGRILVTGPPQYVQIVSDVAMGVTHAPSQNPRQVDIRVFRLRHARAADTVVSIAGTETTIPGVARILNDTLGSARIEVVPISRVLPVAMNGLRGRGQIAIGHNDPAVSADVGKGTRPVLGSSTVSPSSTTPDELSPGDADTEAEAGPGAATLNVRSMGQNPQGRVATAPPSAMTRQRLASDGIVRADPRINAVVVRDTADRMSMYARLIGELDVATPLLEIEATVIDVSRDKSEQLGVDWRLHGQRADIVSSPNALANAGGSTNSANNLLFSLPAQSSGSAGLVGTLLFGSERTNFLARINALAVQGDANLVSKPRVLTLDNTEAVLQSTQDFYVRVAGRDQVDLFNVSLGLVLRVTPTVIDDPRGVQVKLNIRIEDGNTSSGTQVDQIPVVSRNAISTQAVVGDGHSLLIGGYTIDEKINNSSGIPWLSDIPGLRWLFGQKSSSSKRVERIFMITPRLVRPEEMNGTVVPPVSATRLPVAEPSAVVDSQ